jgi:hypothetical protein
MIGMLMSVSTRSIFCPGSLSASTPSEPDDLQLGNPLSAKTTS